MKPDIEELRKKYIENPPEGMTSRDIRHMSDEVEVDFDTGVIMVDSDYLMENAVS